MSNNGNSNMKQSGERVIPVKICDEQFSAIEELARLKANEIDKEDGLVDAVVVMDELGISKETLSNYISSGKITHDMYIESPVNGKKKFRLDLIIGLKK